MPLPALIALIVWFLVVVVLGKFGVIAALQPPLPQAVALSLVVGLVLLFRSWKPFRSWMLTVPIERLIAFHLIRFVGIYFLILYSRGQLPFGFAVPGGIGDAFIAASALAIALFPAVRTRAVLTTWNFVGLADIAMAVASAAAHGVTAPASMTALLRLPLSLLPTFFVPLILFTHIVIRI